MNDGNPSNQRTVVEQGTNFRGTLSSSCPIDVRGRIEGELETPELVVSQSGSVHGRAKVGSVRSEGELSGEFEADSIELAGTVKDNTRIRARSLEVKPSNVRGKATATLGDCELSIGDEPTEFDIVEVPAEAPAEVAAASNEAVVPLPMVDVSAEPAPAHAGQVEEAPGEGAVAPEPVAMEPAVAAEALVVETPHAEAVLEEPSAELAQLSAMIASDGYLAEAAPTESTASVSQEADLDAVLAELGVAPRAHVPAKAEASEAVSADVEPGKPSRKRRRENGEEGEHTGWSQPPSQPPPAH